MIRSDPDTACACVDQDRHECWRRRYALPMTADVDLDGGPCECICHDDDDGDYGPDDDLPF